MEHKFRRPAMLDPEMAEYIIGDEDPADGSGLAHSTAWALLGQPSVDFSEEDVPKVLEAVRSKGVDILAGAWARSPEFTLPGALWRIYLMYQWYQMNPGVLYERYQEGMAAMKGGSGASLESAPNLDEVILAIEGVLAGYATEDDLASVFEVTAESMRVLAASAKYGPQWITEDTHALANPVTRRDTALLDTASELDESAKQAKAGALN
ncbi:hypothetical protein U6G28_04475 [Actinomycetaceae bacterium MB13-C1-2]|nr:hypothetical protein U6G28_04475 [Actinomycetaceae bacterium MB13-C1-2]